MKVAIVGVGLMGGSFALSLRTLGLASWICGYDKSKKNEEKSLELGIIDKIVPFEEVTQEAELIVLSAPVDAIPMQAVKILNKVSGKQVVMDIGSIKEELSEMISQHPKRNRFVATHPMWGTENNGPESAVSTGFKGRTAVICDRELSDKDAVECVENIYKKFGMPISYMSSEEQDLHSAYVSHISHVSAYALATTVLEKETENERIFELAGAGFASTVRLAKSPASMWTPIVLKNKYNVLDVLREYIHQLQIFRKLLENDDEKGIQEFINIANKVKKII